jgi:8-oxo-dGTP diphosphatase
MSLYLVRHAVALPKPTWTGLDSDRPLDAKGVRQVAGLTAWFEARRVDLVVSSPAIRCVTTVLPIANAHETDLITRRALLPGAVEHAQTLLKSLLAESTVEARGIVVCTHGELLPDILTALGHRPYEPPSHAKGSVWVIEPVGQRRRKRAAGSGDDESLTFDYTPPPPGEPGD